MFKGKDIKNQIFGRLTVIEYARLRYGWSLEKTLLTPVKEKCGV